MTNEARAAAGGRPALGTGRPPRSFPSGGADDREKGGNGRPAGLHWRSDANPRPTRPAGRVSARGGRLSARPAHRIAVIRGGRAPPPPVSGRMAVLYAIAFVDRPSETAGGRPRARGWGGEPPPGRGFSAPRAPKPARAAPAPAQPGGALL